MPLLILMWVVFIGAAVMIIRRQQNKIHSLQDRILAIRKQQNKEDQYKWDAAIENEGKRIAHELHDDTVQRMVAVRFRLEQVLYSTIPERAEVEVKAIRKEIDDIIATLRFFVRGLKQPRFEIHPLSILIDQIANSLGAMHHLTVKVETIRPEKEFELQPDVKENLFYLVHEAAHNFLKDSVGSELIITLDWEDGLQIDIVDNGQGLMRARGYGLGMESMKKRAEKINATLEFSHGSSGLGLLVQINLKSDHQTNPLRKA